MDATQRVLSLIAGVSHPVGWYSIERMLGARGIVLEENLITLLSRLIEHGLLTHEPCPGYPQGIYKMTDRGREYLATHA